MDDRFIETFREESYELLQQIEADLLSLESDPTDQDHIQSVFRAAHTIKCSAAMFGFSAISEFAHQFENALEEVRSGEGRITQEMIDLTLRGKDHLRALLEEGSAEGSEELNRRSAEILSELAALFGESREEESAPAAAQMKTTSAPKHSEEAPPGTGDSLGREKTFRISFKPDPDIFTTGTNPNLLLKEIESLGVATVFADTSRVPALADIDPEKLYLAWEILLTTRHSYEEVRDVFIFVESDSQLLIEELSELDYLDPQGEPKRLGEILVDRHVLAPKELKRLLDTQKRIGERVREAGLADETTIEAALHAQEHFKQAVGKQRRETTGGSLRVSSARLDQLIDLVGELVTVQARVGRLSERIEDDGLSTISEELERLIDDLRDNAMSLRMLPIGSTFSQFRRLVRDLSRDLGKSIRLTTSGEETELDKTVIDRLHDPLVHIIRNAIDHGIETPETRRAAGKPEEGTITLEALHAGASVLIVISEDGVGIDAEKVRRRAVDKGLLSPTDTPTDEEIYQYLFAPGFSTAEKVTAVSGRGVGLDVVAKDIQALSGTVGIESEPGKGTRFTLTLPLTLAIIDGLQVSVGGEIYIIPLAAVESCLEIERSGLDSRQKMISHRGQLLPYIDLATFLDIEGEAAERRQMVVIESGTGRMGLIVDEVLGDHQTVIKGLGNLFKGVKGFSGATIMGDGSIALILDVHGLIAAADSATTEDHAART